MARFAYTLLLYLITPLIWLRLLWRGRKQPEYLHHLGERYGFYPQAAPEKLIWVHAVSVGETRAAQPLIDGLLARWPEHRVLLTGMTPTGRAAGKRASFSRLALSPIVRFIKFYFVRQGFRDGLPGLIHIAIGCMNSFLKYAKMFERQNADAALR